jgi:hypothetical protein
MAACPYLPLILPMEVTYVNGIIAGRGVISELDFYRAANLLLDRHRADALIEAARVIDRC